MSQIIFIPNSHIIKPQIAKILKEKGLNCKYLSFEPINEDVESFLSAQNVFAVKDPLSGLSSEEFISAYNDLIAELSLDNKGLLWWATDISSKNRYTSRLPSALESFLKCMNAIKRKDYDFLFIIGASPFLSNHLAGLIKGNDYGIRFKGFYLKGKAFLASYIKRIVNALWTVLLVTGRILCARVFLQKRIAARLTHEPYYVIKSFTYDSSFKTTGVYQDAFFGKLTAHVRGKENLLILVNVLGNYRRAMQEIRKISTDLIIPLEYFVSWWDAWRDSFIPLFFRVKVRKEISFCGYEASEIVKNELRQTGHKIQPYQFLCYSAMKRLAQKVRVKKIVMVYENNPWEKMTILALRKYSPTTQIFSYQHTVIPPAAINLFLGAKEYAAVPLPDKILTLGLESKEMMRHYGSYPEDKIIPACGLRFENVFSKTALPRKRDGNILLALEGIKDVQLMADYVLRELKGDERYKINIRTHPLLPWEYLKKRISPELYLKPNITISHNKSLIEDITEANVVIYWGTAVAMEALKMGRPVIHFNNGFILSFDTLFNCHDLKWTVTYGDSLKKTLEEIDSLDDKKFASQRERAALYLEKYVYKITEDSLNKFIHLCTCLPAGRENHRQACG
ncbi:MAG: hypothetical protein HQL24_05210 [Candidatus Omnitrophica bacterium]|nr:hypothetical protein [Candidatus Omnitrophota bacterium]